MTVAAIALAGGCLVALAVFVIALLVLLDRASRDTAKLVLDLEKRHRDERGELADRIQRPDLLPLRRSRAEPRERREPKDLQAFAKIGTVTPIRDDDENGGPGSGSDGAT